MTLTSSAQPHLTLMRLVLLLLVSGIRPTLITACNFGPGCLFACRCATGGCDPDSGRCETGECAATFPNKTSLNAGWGGYGCLTGNVAYNKTADQIGTHGNASYITADKAVDGIISTVIYGGSCAHPSGHKDVIAGNTDRAAWWRVDLGQRHYIINITLFNRVGGAFDRLNNFGLLVTNTTVVPDRYPSTSRNSAFKLCMNVSSSVPNGGSRTYTCATPLVGQYVLLYRNADPDVHFTHLCEFVAIGNPYIPCTDCTGTCTSQYGCVTCPVGRDPDTYCNTDCSGGWYGDGCRQECGHCESTTCNKLNGTCLFGCQQWWTNARCNQSIDILNFTSTDSVTVTDITSNSLRIHWPAVVRSTNLAHFYGYTVEHNVTKSATWQALDDTTLHEGTTSMLIIEKLKYNTYYDVRVTPYRQHKGQEENGRSISYVMKTLCIDPGRPQLVNATTFYQQAINATIQSINVTWKLPHDSGCDYLQTVEVVLEPTSITPIYLDGTVTQKMVRLKQPGTYTVSVRVSNNEGLSSETEGRVVTVESNEENASKLSVGALIGGLVGLVIVIIILSIILVVLKRRDSRNEKITATANGNTGKRTAPRTAPSNHLETQFVEAGVAKTKIATVHPTNNGQKPIPAKRPPPKPSPAYVPDDTEEAEDLYENADVIVPLSCFIRLADLQRHLKENKSNGKIKAEYESLPSGINAKCEAARDEKNKGLNRFNNIVAYDHTRVVLDIPDQSTKTDYINACWITGYNGKEKAYIATQGPRPATVSDFWRMIWQTKASRIVMLTQFLESGKRQCEEYWPLKVNQSVTHDALTVTTRTTDCYTDYTHSTIIVTDGTTSHKVHHFHFLAWPDKNVPESCFAMLSFRKRVRALDRSAGGAMVVHCSAGVGRTGTFVALDVLLQQAAAEGGVDVAACVRRLRQQRQIMVQTLSQYMYVYEALVDHVVCGDTAVSCTTFRSELPQIKQKLPETLELLKTRKPKYNKEQSSGNLPENKGKNRVPSVLPRDAFRPFLIPRPGGYQDYINAVFADSFTSREAFIVTQTPLPTTLADFWRLVYDHDCKAIVMLDDPDDPQKQYWPESDSESLHGPMKVKLVNTVDQDHKRIVIRDFEVISTPEQSASRSSLVRQYQLRSWVREAAGRPGLTEMTCDLLDLRDLLEKWRQQTGKGRVLVHCNDGASRCGVFVAASHVIDKMKVEHEVDVFLAARYVTEKRPECIDTLDELTMLYDMAAEYLGQYDEYANFQ